MKNHLKFVATIATLLIAAAGVITFEACNKKNEVVNNIPELNVVELSDMDKEMILFGEKIKSAQKGGETMQLEEAVRSLTNYQNFRLCDASKFSSDVERYTIETEIPLIEGNVYLSDIYSIYLSNKTQIRDKLATLDGDDKSVYCINSRVDTNNKDGETARIVTHAILQRDGVIPEPYYFDDELCWEVNHQYCFGCTGGNAISVLDQRLRAIKILGFGCPPGYRVYFVNEVDKDIWAEDYIDLNSPNGHYGLIHGEYDSYCLSADDMRYYLDSALNKINEWSNELDVEGKVVELIWYVPISPSYLLACFADASCTYVGLDD